MRAANFAFCGAITSTTKVNMLWSSPKIELQTMLKSNSNFKKRLHHSNYTYAILHTALGDNRLVNVDVQSVTCWHNVVVIHDLHEWLHAATFGNKLLVHSLGNLNISEWAAVNKYTLIQTR